MLGSSVRLMPCLCAAINLSSCPFGSSCTREAAGEPAHNEGPGLAVAGAVKHPRRELV